MPFPGYTGYQYIGGGLLMKFGFCTIPIPAPYSAVIPYNFTYPVATNIPAFNSTPFYIIGQPGPTGTSTSFFRGISILNTTSYTISSQNTSSTVATANGQKVFWLAIGV